MKEKKPLIRGQKRIAGDTLYVCPRYDKQLLSGMTEWENSRFQVRYMSSSALSKGNSLDISIENASQ